MQWFQAEEALQHKFFFARAATVGKAELATQAILDVTGPEVDAEISDIGSAVIAVPQVGDPDAAAALPHAGREKRVRQKRCDGGTISLRFFFQEIQRGSPLRNKRRALRCILFLEKKERQDPPRGSQASR